MESKTQTPSSDNPELLKAIQVHRNGHLKQADELYNNILTKEPNNALALHMYGALKHQIGDSESGFKLINRALQINPNNPHALNNLGKIFHSRKQYEQARNCYLKSLELEPKGIDTLLSLAALLQETNYLEAALIRIKEILAIDPNNLQALLHLANAYRKDGEYEKALQCSLRTLEIAPNNSLVHCNIGVVYYSMQEFEKAEQHYKKTLELDVYHASVHNNLGLMYLLTNRYDEGWLQYEWRWNTGQFYGGFQHSNKAIWRGEDLTNKTLLIWQEQGYGDTVFVLRYLPAIKQKYNVKHIILECRPPLLKLVKNSLPDIEVISTKSKKKIKFDEHCPIMGILAAYNANLDNIPGETPYLKVDEKCINKWKKQLPSSKEPKVGLVWAGSPENAGDRLRSVNITDYIPLLNLPLTFICLQLPERAVDIEQQSLGHRITDISDKLTDFHETAAVIANLDLVICVDTAVGHVAGALNIPVWTLHQYIPDWRWQINTSSTPWYPSMKLFRQGRDFDWSRIIAEVKAEVITTFKLKT